MGILLELVIESASTTEEINNKDNKGDILFRKSCGKILNRNAIVLVIIYGLLIDSKEQNRRRIERLAI